MSHARRYDRAVRMSKADATPQGGIRCDANLTRTGVLTYIRPDGTRSREYRPPSEVFAQDSLASLRGAPLTIGHPGMVTPERYRELNVGHVGDDVRPEGQFVASGVRIQDAAAVAGVMNAELVELSAGYTVDLVPGKGVTPEGEEYDATHTNIRYNHVALLPAGGGRAGRDVALKLDGDDAALEDPSSSSATYVHDGTSQYASSSMTPEQIAALQAQLAAAQAQVAKLETEARLRQDHAAEIATLTGANKALTAQIADLTTKVATAEARADAASAPAALDALVAKRAEIVTKARGIVGDKFDAAGKTDIAIMREALTVAHPSVKFDSDAEVKGAFAVLAVREAAARDARGAVLEASTGAGGQGRSDANEDPFLKADKALNSGALAAAGK